MFLYHSTIQKSPALHGAVPGSFIKKYGTDIEQIAAIRGTSSIDIIVLDEATGQLNTISSTDTFSTVRNLAAVRPPNFPHDLLAVTSDSGNFVLLMVTDDGSLKAIFCHPYGKTGILRTVPGEHLNVDPSGRAIMIGAAEKCKLVYLLTPKSADEESNDEIPFKVSSPLEAHRPNHSCISIAPLENGFGNPLFLVSEVEYVNEDTSGDDIKSYSRKLTVYEVEIGLNHVKRSASCVLKRPVNHIIPVGIKSAICCSPGFVSLYSLTSDGLVCKASWDFEGGLIVNSARVTFNNQQAILLQDENGSIFKGEVTGDSFTLTLFQKLALSGSIVFVKSGFLFMPGICSDHELYQLLSLDGEHEERLNLVCSMPNISPLLKGCIENIGKEETPQLYYGTGHGKSASFSVLRPGLPVTEYASSALPFKPNGIWTTKEHIAISSSSQTIFLSIGESLEEAADVPFKSEIETLYFGATEDNGVLHISPQVFTHYAGGKQVEWNTPHGMSIVSCASNSRQVAIVLSNNSIVYFELFNGIIRELGRKNVSSTILCIAFSPIPAQRQRGKFLAIGCDDSVIRVLSCDPGDRFEQLAIQAAASKPSSLIFTDNILISDSALCLHVGLENGVYVRLAVKRSSGALEALQTRYLGSEPVKFNYANMEFSSVIALSSKTWIYSDNLQSKGSRLIPLSYNVCLLSVAPFVSENIDNAVVGVCEDSLKIFNASHDGTLFSSTKIAVDATIRSIEFVEDLQLFCLVESEFEEGRSKSAVRLLCPFSGSTLLQIPFQNGKECALVAKVLKFHDRGSKLFLIVGTSTDFCLMPRSCSSSRLITYELTKAEDLLEAKFLHTTVVEDIPSVMSEFCGRFLLGAGKVLRLYDMGKSKLLRKSEVQVPSFLTSLSSQGLRIYAADARESVLLVIYRPDDNRLVLFADDVISRSCTTLCVVDFETIIAADRHGNAFALRLPLHISESIDKDPGAVPVQSRDNFFAAPQKLEHVCEFHVGEIIMSLAKTSMIYGGQQVLLYTTILGRIGFFAPLIHRSQASAIQTLESCLRSLPPLKTSVTGRLHATYRSSFNPVKAVTDGDFCTLFYGAIDPSERSMIADKCDKAIDQLDRIISDIQSSAGI